jgi:hypothetical protein
MTDWKVEVSIRLGELLEATGQTAVGRYARYGDHTRLRPHLNDLFEYRLLDKRAVISGNMVRVRLSASFLDWIKPKPGNNETASQWRDFARVPIQCTKRFRHWRQLYLLRVLASCAHLNNDRPRTVPVSVLRENFEDATAIETTEVLLRRVRRALASIDTASDGNVKATIRLDDAGTGVVFEVDSWPLKRRKSFDQRMKEANTRGTPQANATRAKLAHHSTNK